VGKREFLIKLTLGIASVVNSSSDLFSPQILFMSRHLDEMIIKRDHCYLLILMVQVEVTPVIQGLAL
jgi:hypothetical protein